MIAARRKQIWAHWVFFHYLPSWIMLKELMKITYCLKREPLVELTRHKVVVLVDSIISHNFIPSTLVQERYLHVAFPTPYIVDVGDERKITCERIYKKN